MDNVQHDNVQHARMGNGASEREARGRELMALSKDAASLSWHLIHQCTWTSGTRRLLDET